MAASHPPILGKQGALLSIDFCEVVACPFMGAFAFADESAGYKTMLWLKESDSSWRAKATCETRKLTPFWLRPKACI